MSLSPTWHKSLAAVPPIRVPDRDVSSFLEDTDSSSPMGPGTQAALASGPGGDQGLELDGVDSNPSSPRQFLTALETMGDTKVKQKRMLLLYELETQEKNLVKWSIRSFACIDLLFTTLFPVITTPPMP